MATNKASGLTTSAILLADRKEKQGERYLFDSWAIRYGDMTKRKLSKQQWFAEYQSNDKRLTDYSWGAVEKYFNAFGRAVKKYGSLDNAKKQYLLDTRRMYVEVSKFVAWCPDGQRAKNVPKKDAKQSLYETVTLTRSEANKRLSAYPKAMREDIIKSLGIK